MGLIKLALAGGAGYYVIKTIKGEREKKHERHLQEMNQNTRAIPDEKPYSVQHDNNIPPSYPLDQYHQYPPTYQNDRQISQSQSQPQPQPSNQEMIFTDPKRPHQLTNAPHDNDRALQSTRSIAISNASNDEALEEAMRYLNSGDQEKARQVLAGAIGRKY